MLMNDPKKDWRGRAACRISSVGVLHVEDRWEAHLYTPRALCALLVDPTWCSFVSLESRKSMVMDLDNCSEWWVAKWS